MIFAQIPAGGTVFLDANTLIYHFAADPKYGAACTQLVKQIEQQHLTGFVSTHALADVAHRLMTIEAMLVNGWSVAGIAARLRKHHDVIPKLTVYRQAIAALPHLGIQVIPVMQSMIEAATIVSEQHELLTGDALIVAVMQAHNLSNLASNDDDFDRLPGIVRYAPV